MSKSITIIAIHGTGAVDAPWAQPTSPFKAMIERHLAHQSIIWIAFPWSGQNTHAAREIAATELADLIASTALKHSSTTIHLIGHSHGGNIALMALSWNAHARSLVSSATCMATPFLHRDLAQLTTHAHELDHPLPSYYAKILYLLALLALISDFALPIRLAFALLCLSVAVWVARFLKRIHAEIYSQNLERIQSYYLYAVIKCPVLAIRATLDEALFGLKGGLIFSQVATLMHWLTKILFALLLLGVVAMPLLVVVLIIWTIAAALLGASLPKFMGEFVNAWFHLGLLSAFVVPIVLLIIRLIRAALRFGPILFGEGLPLTYLSAFSCQAWPLDVRKLRRVTVRPILPFPFGRHSYPHGSESCAKEIASFLSSLRSVKSAA